MLHNWETSINACASALEMEAKRLMLKYGRVRRHPVIVLESCDEGGEETDKGFFLFFGLISDRFFLILKKIFLNFS